MGDAPATLIVFLDQNQKPYFAHHGCSGLQIGNMNHDRAVLGVRPPGFALHKLECHALGLPGAQEIQTDAGGKVIDQRFGILLGRDIGDIAQLLCLRRNCYQGLDKITGENFWRAPKRLAGAQH